MTRSVRLAAMLACSLPLFCGPVSPANQLVADVEHYYVDAQWVCRSFQTMHLNELTRSWTFIVGLMTNPSRSWWYFCDSPQAYTSFCDYHCVDLAEFARLSAPVAWVQQCQAYERFFTTYELDANYDVVVPVAALQPGAPLSRSPVSGMPASRMPASGMPLMDVLSATGAQTMTAFYVFYFENAVNVFLRAIDFIDRAQQPEPADIQLVGTYKKVLDTVYQKCQALCQRADARTHRQLAFHYQRTRQVWDMVCAAKHIDPFNLPGGSTMESLA